MTPLHRAVIEDDHDVLRDRDLVSKWKSVPDKLGFIPVEIARFLGRYQALELLDEGLSKNFKLQPNGMKAPLSLSLEGFEKALGIHYRPFLTFSSYQLLEEVVNNCPYVLRSQTLASDNYEWTKAYHQELCFGQTASIYIKWIDEALGYGAFAEEEILPGCFIGEYTGIVRRLSRNHSDYNPYCFHYPTRFWSLKYFVVDSMREGNLTRFINHSNNPNLQPLCLVDRGVLHQVFVAKNKIKKDEQLTFDYGDDYWAKRKKVKI